MLHESHCTVKYRNPLRSRPRSPLITSWVGGGEGRGGWFKSGELT